MIRLLPYIQLFVTLLMVGASGEGTLRAQQAAGSADPQASEPEPAKGEAQVRFEQALAEFKEAIRTIEELRSEYQGASAERRKTINAQLQEQVLATRPKSDAMVEAALAAYQENSGENQAVTHVLLAVAQHYAMGKATPNSGGNVVGGDQYEKALPIINALVEGGTEKKELALWGFLSAWATNELDLASKYFETAKTNGAIADLAGAEDAVSQQVLQTAVQYEGMEDEFRRMWEKEKQIREAEAAADDLPRVKLTTTKGEIVVELFENEAPETVANFLTLVKQGFYDGTPYHRVLPVFMAQGGDPTGTGQGGPGYTIKCECYRPDRRDHFRGSLSMAHAGRDTGGSQYFLTFVPTSFLNGRHTVFGRVIEGIEVLGELQRRDPEASAPHPEPDKILSAEVLRDRGHDYTFQKLPGR